MAKIFYTVSPSLHRVARLEGEEVVELDFEIPDKPISLLGNIYLGRVIETQKTLHAAFVDVGLRDSGLLPLREGKLLPVKQGDAVLVQINRTANPLEDKGVRLTRLITLSLGPLLYTPFVPGLSLSKKLKNSEAFKNLFPLEPEEGLVIRHGASRDDPLLDLFFQLREEWATLHAQITQKPPFCLSPPITLLSRVLRSLSPSDTFVIDDRKMALLTKGRGVFSSEKAFDEACEDAWDSLSSIEIPLNQEGSLFIEETHGAVVIDVNSRGSLKHSLHFNKLAIKESLRQLRLRELGGKIVIDLIGAPKELPPLLQGLIIPSDVEIFSLSPLHLLEMIRRRRGLSLPQRLQLQLN